MWLSRFENLMFVGLLVWFNFQLRIMCCKAAEKCSATVMVPIDDMVVGIRNYKRMQGIICRWYVAVSIFLASILHTSIHVSYFLLRFYSVPHTHTQAIAYCLTLAPKGSFFRFWFYTCRPAKHPPTFHAIFNSTSNTHPLLIEVTDSIPPMLPATVMHATYLIYLPAFFNGRFIYYW